MLGFLKKLFGGGKSSSGAQEQPADDVPCPSALEPDPDPDPSPAPMPTSECKATDIRRPGGRVPRGDELSPKEAKQGSVMLDADDPLKGRPSKPDSHWSERPLDDSSSIPALDEREDHLGKAAVAKHAAKQAIREKRFDDAWRLLHEQQSEWLSHANRQRFTRRQTLSLLSSIYEDMANILRMEGKHDDALANILYCVAANSRPTQAQKKKLGSYFRRCKFSSAYDETQPERYAELLRLNPDLRGAQVRVQRWRSGTADIISEDQVEESLGRDEWVTILGGRFLLNKDADIENVDSLERKIISSRHDDSKEFWAGHLAKEMLKDWDEVNDAHGAPIQFKADLAATLLAHETELRQAIVGVIKKKYRRS